jgi:hypothetical protein
VAALHDRAGYEERVFHALAATQFPRRALKSVGLGHLGALRAEEAVAPAKLFKVRRAGRVIGKETLKIGERSRKRKVGSHEVYATRTALGGQPDKHGLKHLIIEQVDHQVIIRSAIDDAQGTGFKLLIPLFLLPAIIKGLEDAYAKGTKDVDSTKIQVRL